MIITMSINRNFRRPDGFLMAYPATQGTKNNYFPSVMSGLDDPIISDRFLNLVTKYHLADDYELYKKHSQTQYASPLLGLSKEVLAQFPKSIMLLGGIDPLKDQGIMFASKMIEAGVDLKIRELEMMPHGILNYYIPNGLFGMPEGDKVIRMSIEMLAELA